MAFQGLLLPFVAEKLDMIDDSQNVMKTFSDYQDEQDIQLIQIRREDGNTVIPRGDTIIQQGDVLVMNSGS